MSWSPSAIEDTEHDARRVIARRAHVAVGPVVPSLRTDWMRALPVHAIEPIEAPDRSTPACPACTAAQIVRPAVTLTERGFEETSMGWRPHLDELGKLHAHDPNIRTTHYSCSNGHTFNLQSGAPCPSCRHGHPKET